MKKISLFQALIPILLLVLLLFFNVFFVFGDEALDGSNQFILLIGGAIAALIGFYNGVPYKTMISEISEKVMETLSLESPELAIKLPSAKKCSQQ